MGKGTWVIWTTYSVLLAGLLLGERWWPALNLPHATAFLWSLFCLAVFIKRRDLMEILFFLFSFFTLRTLIPLYGALPEMTDYWSLADLGLLLLTFAALWLIVFLYQRDLYLGSGQKP